MIIEYGDVAQTIFVKGEESRKALRILVENGFLSNGTAWITVLGKWKENVALEYYRISLLMERNGDEYKNLKNKFEDVGIDIIEGKFDGYRTIEWYDTEMSKYGRCAQ